MSAAEASAVFDLPASILTDSSVALSGLLDSSLDSSSSALRRIALALEYLPGIG
jgi:hypothetical protein